MAYEDWVIVLAAPITVGILFYGVMVGGVFLTVIIVLQLVTIGILYRILTLLKTEQ